MLHRLHFILNGIILKIVCGLHVAVLENSIHQSVDTMGKLFWRSIFYHFLYKPTYLPTYPSLKYFCPHNKVWSKQFPVIHDIDSLL